MPVTGVPFEVNVQLSGAYRIEQLDRLIRGLSPLLALEERAVTLIDLSGLVAVGPAALALLTATVDRIDRNSLWGEGSAVVLPKSAAVRNYVIRMGVLHSVISKEQEPFARGVEVGFRPCKSFDTGQTALDVTRGLAETLVERCDDVDELAKFSIEVCLGELAENVLHHAESPLGGFAAAQGWEKSKTVELAMVDLGIGIRASLTKNAEYADIADDVLAIRTALEPRVTSTPERNSGIGLYVTRLLLRENGGVLLIRSGEGRVYAGAEESGEMTNVAFPGTVVALRARTDCPLNIKQIYRTHLPYDDDETDDQAS